MIQVCAQCGTRWNVRDRQRVWCPRCRGTLLAPGVEPQPPAATQVPAPPAPDPRWNSRPPGQQPPPRPAGFRWIAVRPGPAPAPRPRRIPLGPTPRYTVIPRWGLYEQFGPEQDVAPARTGPSQTLVRRTLIATIVLLGAAALAHIVRYVLLLINRTVLLNPLLAGAVTWLGIVTSVFVVFAVVATAVVLTNWLIARRAAAFAHLGGTDPRSSGELWAGCLIPVVNLLLAPVFVIELARAEQRTGLPIVRWWITWFVSYAVSLASVVTTVMTIFYDDAQRIADNTVITTVGYLVALATVLLVLQVYQGFERAPVDRPAQRWVAVGAGPAGPARVADTNGESAVPVEDEGRNPAA